MLLFSTSEHLWLGNTGYTNLQSLPLTGFQPLRYKIPTKCMTGKAGCAASPMHHPKVQWSHTGPVCWSQSSKVPEHRAEKDGMDGAYVNLGVSTAEVTAPGVPGAPGLQQGEL